MSLDNIEKKRIKLINNWFVNLKNNIKNEDILFLICKQINIKSVDELKTDIDKNYLNDTDDKPQYDVFDISKINKYSINNTNLTKNIILIGDGKTPLSSLKNVKRKLLFITIQDLTCKITNNSLLRTLTVEKEKIELTELEHLSLYIENKSPLEIINKYDNEIKSFIFKPLGDEIYIKESTPMYLLRDTNLSGNYNELIDKKTKVTLSNENQRSLMPNNTLTIVIHPLNEYINNDIAILKEKNILTSRLSILIYRKSFLDAAANTTEIGCYFSKEFGSKSKVVNLKKICKGSSVNYDGLSKTTVKAYDLNIKSKSENEIRNELEKEIKENIAKKLLYFTDIDIDTIQRIVELPKSTLKKYR